MVPFDVVTSCFNAVISDCRRVMMPSHLQYQWCTEQEQEQAKWVPQKDVITLLPYIGLHSNYITKSLKSCVNRFHSFVDVKVIFENTRRIKSLFPYKDHLNRLRLSKVVDKASCWDCNDFDIGKTKRRVQARKRDISRPFWNVMTLLLLVITWTDHNIKWGHFYILASSISKWYYGQIFIPWVFRCIT